MKIVHPQFGEIEVTAKELVELGELMQGNKAPKEAVKKEEKKTPIKNFKKNADKYTTTRGTQRKNAFPKKPRAEYTDEEIRFIAENLDSGNLMDIAKHPRLLKNHSVKSSYSMCYMIKGGQFDKLKPRIKEILAEVRPAQKEYLPPVSAYTEA